MGIDKNKSRSHEVKSISFLVDLCDRLENGIYSRVNPIPVRSHVDPRRYQETEMGGGLAKKRHGYSDLCCSVR